MVNPVVFLSFLAVNQPEPIVVRELHLASAVPGPSNSQFNVYVNGKSARKVTSTQKLNLTEALRRGLNKVEVHFDAWTSKLSLFHPSTLKLTDGPAKIGRELLSIRANIDNPRGVHRLWIRFEPSTPA